MRELEDGGLDEKILDEGFQVRWGGRSLTLNEVFDGGAKIRNRGLNRGKGSLDGCDGGSWGGVDWGDGRHVCSESRIERRFHHAHDVLHVS